MPYGAGISRISPRSRSWSCAKLSATITPSPAAALSVHVVDRLRRPARSARCRRTLFISIGGHHRRLASERDAVVAEHLHTFDARQRCDLWRHRRREPRRADVETLRGHDEQIGIERRVHPLHDRPVDWRVPCRANGDDERQRQHQRGDARRSPSGRLDEAVGRKGAFDRRGCRVKRGRSARRQADAQHGSEEQRHGDRAGVADEKRPAGLACDQHSDRAPMRGPAPERQSRKRLSLGRQDLMAAFLECLHGIDACGASCGDRGGHQAREHANRDRHSQHESDRSPHRPLVCADAVQTRRPAR